MRKIKREVCMTTVQVLEYKDGGVVEKGRVTLEGEPNAAKIKREVNKRYKDDNVFVGKIETANEVYEMDAETFMRNATKVD